MPVTVKPVSHAPRAWQRGERAASAQELLEGSCPSEYSRCKKIIQSSFSNETPSCPSSNGFVQAAVAAYCDHHHLTIRPEDVWFAILSQVGFFINGRAEEVRTFFVAHKGQKELEVIEVGTIDTVDFGALAVRMTQMIAKSVIDPELRTWMMPDFSTTTESDRVVASILVMGAMQKYFTYSMNLICGIPSVTLLGDRSDWTKMLNRLEMLLQLGAEPTQFCNLLKPVLRYFVMSFDSPSDTTVISFWRRIAHWTGGSGPYYLSGWITAFCFWDADGKCLYSHPEGPIEIHSHGHRNPGCDLDGTLYHRVDTENIPDGYASVPVKVNDNGSLYYTRMVAGSVGISVTSSGDVLDIGKRHDGERVFNHGPDGKLVPIVMEPELGQDPGLDSVQPVSGWWMYEVLGGEDIESKTAAGGVDISENETVNQENGYLDKIEEGVWRLDDIIMPVG